MFYNHKRYELMISLSIIATIIITIIGIFILAGINKFKNNDTTATSCTEACGYDIDEEEYRQVLESIDDFKKQGHKYFVLYAEPEWTLPESANDGDTVKIITEDKQWFYEYSAKKGEWLEKEPE
jgi:heme/copper-type cytochrome/quinol oxidase subunit 2